QPEPEEKPEEVPAVPSAPEAEAERPAQEPEPKKEENAESEAVIRAKAQRLTGPNVVGKIKLPVEQPRRRDQPVASSSNVSGSDHKRKRKRKDAGTPNTGPGGTQRHGRPDVKGNRTAPGRPDFRNKGRSE